MNSNGFKLEAGAAGKQLPPVQSPPPPAGARRGDHIGAHGRPRPAGPGGEARSGREWNWRMKWKKQATSNTGGLESNSNVRVGWGCVT